MPFSSMICCIKGSNRKDQGKKKWRIYSLKELLRATNNFNYDNKLGEGESGSVYWGQLWDGSQIAVKRWRDEAPMEFAVEVEILARIHHKNLLSLRGYCAEGQERLIVYDYMENSSLHSHLHGQHSTECLLDWNRRMKIAIGAAEGITYLHRHAKPHIIHRGIKASNVLLNSIFEAQVADFGYAGLIPEGAARVRTRAVVTLGYLAPEYAMFGKASESCDVFSFGILLLELATGKKPVDMAGTSIERKIVDWALPLARERKFDKLADPKLNGNFETEELKRVVFVALVSTQREPEKRPTMIEVVDLLKGVSKEKLTNLENGVFFKTLAAERNINSSDLISADKEVAHDPMSRWL